MSFNLSSFIYLLFVPLITFSKDLKMLIVKDTDTNYILYMQLFKKKAQQIISVSKNLI